MTIFDPDKGLSGLVVNHEPLTALQLKRLLLVFDQVNLTPPKDQIYFLEEGAICYYYDNTGDLIHLKSLNGFEMQERFKNTQKPSTPIDALPVASILNYGGSKDANQKPYQAFLLSNVLPLYNGEENKKEEEKLLDRFEKAIEKNNLKILDYKKTDFYQQNAISLKIAYDYDASDSNCVKYVNQLFREEGKTQIDMFLPSPPLPELSGVNIFPKPYYKKLFTNSQREIDNDFERQYFSIIGKVNKKLAISSEYNLMPIFIDPHIYNFYQYKVNRAKDNRDLVLQKEWLENYNYGLMNLNNLIFQSSYLYASDRVLSELTIPQILAYKERSIDELYKLRLRLATEINSIVSTNYKDLDLKDLENLIKTKLAPDFVNYQKSQNEILSKILNKTIKYTIGVGAAYLGFVQGLSPLLIAVLGGVSPNLADDTLALSSKLREKKKKNYENTFSYYLNLTKSIAK
ncbi:hypothetical protein ACM55M_09885 [Flavobacterium sp. ZT3R25]|uniref:hypothetical protein n=1 Tax=Flavobacterium galactosi TaxID=3398735 RepID=UPI003A8539A5